MDALNRPELLDLDVEFDCDGGSYEVNFAYDELCYDSDDMEELSNNLILSAIPRALEQRGKSFTFLRRLVAGDVDKFLNMED